MKKKTVIFYGLLIIVLIFFFYPVYFAFSLAFNPNVTYFQWPPNYFFIPSLSNIIGITRSWKFDVYLTNSIIASITSVILSLLISLPATYVLTRFNIPKKGLIVHLILMFRFFPTIAIALPLYILYTSIGLYDTLLGLILVYILLNIPFIVWLMRGYFMDIPRDLEEAYEIDGMSKTQVFFRVTMPLVYKGLLATALFCLIFTWNDFAIALILTGANARTLPGQTVSSMQFGPAGTAAAAILIALPMIVFGLIIRRYLIRGLSLGAVR